MEHPEQTANDVILDKNGAPKTDLTDQEDRTFRYSY